MRRYLVVYEHTCPVCEGARFLYSELWKEANAIFDKTLEEHNKAGREPGDDDLDRYYKALQAASAASDKYWRKLGYNAQRRLPPEEEPCGECEAAGIIRKEIDLEQALEDLGLVVRREA